MTNIKNTLLNKIATRAARVGVIGLGYVGLPLVVEFARGGFDSLGFEVDQRKSAAVNRGESYIPDVPTAQVAELVAAKKLSATTDFSQLRERDLIIICVPTPLRKTKDPDVSYILAAAEKIRETLRAGQLIILESTTYPGTTDEVLRPMFDETGLKIDEDYFLAFSPERVDPGNEKFNTRNIPKVVGGVTPASGEVAGAAYSHIVEKVYCASSARVAEACKLLENTFRAVNIGLVNELAQLCHTLGIDTWEVIGAAATKPFGFMPFYPGPGIGGHCLIGEETVVVRSVNEKKERIESIASLYSELLSEQRDSGTEGVILNPKIEALSLNTETQMPEWKAVSHFFRRSFQGDLVKITTSDNRRLTVTDEHPMLISDQAGSVRQVFAKDLKIGDRLPIHCLPAPVMGGLQADLESEKIDLLSRTFKHSGMLVTVPVKSVEIRQTDHPIGVYSFEVEGNHTFAASYGIYVHNCIPLDPHYLSWKARMHGFEARFISLAEEVNSRMPEHVVELVTKGLNQHRKPVNGSRILILGVAYKRDIDDMRESPALAIIEKLQKLGGLVSYHDPYVEQIHLEANDEQMRGIAFDEETVSGADCVVIVTDHRKLDYAWLVEKAKLIVDTRNATRGLADEIPGGKVIRL